ncbi:MAG: MoaD/ThiS family protein [Christensenellales bacterium]|jgi:molybdopterin converting factor small subunit
MIKVEFFGNYRMAFKTAEILIEADNLKELINEISKRFSCLEKEEIANAVFFINDKAVKGLFKSRVRLNDGDRVLMMSPSGGG